MTRPGDPFAWLWRGMLARVVAPAAADPTSRPIAPTFGQALTELQCALATFELIDEIMTADGFSPTERDRKAHIYASWSLARAADRLGRAYGNEIDAGGAA